MDDRAILNPLLFSATAGPTALRAHEDAATAIGRLDATARLSSNGARELLVLRCMVTPFTASRDAVIELLRRPGEDSPQSRYAGAIRTGSARAKGGVVPSVEYLLDLLQTPTGTADSVPGDSLDAAHLASVASAINETLRDARVRTPPVLKAAVVAGALLESADGSAPLAALATSLVLCVGGAISDTWLTLPVGTDATLSSGPATDADGWNDWLGLAFAALAREARAAEHGIAAAADCVDADRGRIREALGRAAYSALDLLELLANEIVISVPDAARALGQTPPTAGAAVARLVDLGIAQEITGRSRSREFAYGGMVDALAPHRAPAS